MAWKWNNSEKTNMLPVNFCRDQNLFDLTYPNLPEMKEKMENHQLDNIIWSWPTSDGRQIRLPSEIVNYLPQNGNLVRDVVGYVSQCHIDQLNNPIIQTNYHKISEGIGLAYNSDKIQEIKYALGYAKSLQICNQTIYTVENGKTVKSIVDFNFIDWIQRIEEIDGIAIPHNQIKTRIKISDIYGNILQNNKGPKAPIPVAALEKANKSVPKYISPAKNLIYRLAARVPKTKFDYKYDKLANIIGFKTTRKDRLFNSINNTIEILYPIMVADYNYDPVEDKYLITLAGHLTPNDRDANAR